MNDKYILNKDGEPLLEPDLMTWGKAFEKASDRIVKQEHIGDLFVSTVFLGLDHSFGDGPPILWETMVFKKGTYDDLKMDRCSGTREQALAMHQAMVERVTARMALEK